MGTTLTYGRQRPTTGDRGSYFWDALKDNITLDDAHSHNGVNSIQLATTALSTGASAVTNSGWTADGDWFYKTVTMPTGYEWGACQISFFLISDSNQIFPRTVRVNSTSYKLYMPVDNAAVDVLYT
jgi:hypothetical protein